jgi:hypothetical protein
MINEPVQVVFVCTADCGIALHCILQIIWQYITHVSFIYILILEVKSHGK